MKRFEVTEDPYFLHGGEKFVKGDIRSHEDGQMFIDLGWAKDAETGVTGERVEGISKLKVVGIKSNERTINK